MKNRKAGRAATATAKRPQHDLQALREIVLRAAVEGEPLPGTSGAIRFPDLAFLQQHDSIYVADEGMAGTSVTTASAKPVRILSPAAVQAKVKEGGPLAYLQFGPSRIDGDTAEITLAGRMASPDPQAAVDGPEQHAREVPQGRRPVGGRGRPGLLGELDSPRRQDRQVGHQKSSRVFGVLGVLAFRFSGRTAFRGQPRAASFPAEETRWRPLTASQRPLEEHAW